ncbi:MAG: hypothetical protein HY900_20745 [Deltaproteobacteria bacterium]|nr:hypothetical protein [Deltaproteobacteria bacterium]
MTKAGPARLDAATARRVAFVLSEGDMGNADFDSEAARAGRFQHVRLLLFVAAASAL